MKEKMSAKKCTTIVLLLLLAVIMTVTALTTTIFASDGIEVIGEMLEDVDGGKGIAEAFESYKIQDTVKTKDSWVGDMQYTVYFDRGEDNSRTVIPGYNQTKIIVYTVNTGVERIGTHTNKSIIQSMLDRGYVVIVLDYLNPKNADSLALGTSGSRFAKEVQAGKHFDKTTDIGKTVFAQSGTYYERYLVTSGYDITIDNVFWEIDKHSTEGTLDKIVENWNSDFKTALPNKIVKWVREDGTRKTTVSVDGTAPEWFSDAAGKAPDANGQYTKVKYTVAETITDCVDPDGSPLEMNLYTTVTYPTSPKTKVPVIAKASSNGDLTTTHISSDNPHYYDFVYQGYAVSAYDYLWVPMGQDQSFGYYDGSQGNTGDHMNYGLMMYNDKLVNTAAIRFLRYLSVSGGDTFNFNLDTIGVLGISKGGWFKFLGEKVVQSPLANGSYATLEEKEEAINAALSAFMSDRYYSEHHGETRYQVSSGAIEGDVYTGEYTIEAGAKQPWLTYPDGNEIISGAQAIYAANGSQQDDITEGHMPTFEISCLYDTFNAAYGSTNDVINVCKTLDIPIFYFDAPLAHTWAWGPDLVYGIDTYQALMNFFGYYVKGDAVTVLYTEPKTDEREVSVTDKITIKFMGTVTKDAVESITVSSPSGTVSGSWTASSGNTEWTFTPDLLEGSTTYTVTIPADFKGDNGREIGAAYTTTFVTEKDGLAELTGDGDHYTFTAPEITTGNAFSFRFTVENNAINTAELYAVSGKDATLGELLGKVNVNGNGTYEIDVTEYVTANSGKEITLLLKKGRATSDETVINDTMSGTLSSNLSKGNKATLTASSSVDGRNALMAVITTPTTYGVSKYYPAETLVLNYKNVTGGYTVTQNDIGRTYTFSIDIYDTISRTVTLRLKGMTDKTEKTLDYDRTYVNAQTKAGEWTTVEFKYTVYEPAYGKISDSLVQTLSIHAATDGNGKTPLYFSNFKVVENLTDLEVKSAYIAEKYNGTYAVPESEKAFAIYNGETLVGEYDSWKSALGAYASGYTVKLQRSYVLTDSDVTSAISGFGVVNVDLGKYTVSCENTAKSLLWIKASDKSACAINITGGTIRLGRTALVSYEESVSGGSGKKVNINLQNTHIALGDLAYASEIISASNGTSGVEISSNISLLDCIVDMPAENHATVGSTLFPASKTTGLDIAYRIAGGDIRLTSTRWVVLTDNMNAVEMSKNSLGEYVTLTTPSYIDWDVEGSFRLTDGYATFEMGEGVNGYITRTLEIEENSTKYGIIPEEYLDENTYPIVLFKNGAFVSAHKGVKVAINAANTALKGEENANATAELLLRRDFIVDEEPSYGISAGTLIFDLGGHTLTRGRLILNAVVTSTTPMYDTTVIYKNGRIDTEQYATMVTHCLYKTESTKTFNIQCDNITFGFHDNFTLETVTEAFYAIWHNGNSTILTTNLTLNDCTFDLANNAPAKGGTLFKLDTANSRVNLKINGGKIIGDGSKFTFAKIDSYDTLVLGRNANGEYLAYDSSMGGSPVTYNFLCDDGKYRNFQSTGAGYELKENNLVTPYGAIDAQYADEKAYPFAVFDGKGNFLGAYSTFVGANKNDSTTAISKAKAYLTSNTWDEKQGEYVGNEIIILLRSDYTYIDNERYDNMSQIKGKITLDLGGHSMSENPNSSTKRPLFTLTFKSWGNNGKNPVTFFPTTFNIKNGSLYTHSSSMFVVNAWQTSDTESMEGKIFKFEFDSVNFGLLPGATVSEMLLKINNSSAASGCSFIGPGVLDLKFNDCTFDLNTNRSSASTFTLFDANVDSGKWIRCTVNVNGGEILCNNASGIKLFASNDVYDSYIRFGEGKDGEYITLKTSPTTAPYTDKFPTADGGRYFVEMQDDTISSVYYLTSLTTPYGTVPHDTITANPGYLSAIDYPFLLFMDGSFKRVDTTWGLALSHVKDYIYGASAKGKTAEIVLRRDYTNTSSDSNSSFIAYIGGTAVIDLNGHTLTRDAAWLFDNYSKSTSGVVHDTSIVVKNGTLLAKKAISNFNHTSSSVVDGVMKHWNYLFEGVTFKASPALSSDYFVFATWQDGSKGCTVDVTFNDCIFDITELPKKMPVLHFSDSKNLTDVDVTFNGCKILAGDLTGYTFLSLGTGDTVSFGKGSDGSYLTLSQPSSIAFPTVSYTAKDGKEFTYAKLSTNGTNTVYGLGESIVTKYGDIPYRYASAEEYPYVVFLNGKFVVATSVFGKDGSTSALHNSKTNGSIILVRRDVVYNESQYNNLSQTNGSIIIDLDGHTISMKQTGGNPWLYAQKKTQYDSSVTVINGTLLTGSSPIVRFASWSAGGNYTGGNNFDIIFDGVTIGVLEGYSPARIFYTDNNPTVASNTNGNLVIKNSTIDLSGVAKTVLFEISDPSGIIDVDVTVTDTVIKGVDVSGITFIEKITNENSSVTMTGVELHLPRGAQAPSEIFNGIETFAKAYETADGVVYKLIPGSVAALEYAPKMSITLDRNLVMNVYIPLESTVKFTFDGTEYTDLQKMTDKIVTLDGKQYYKLVVELPSASAARDVLLVTTVDLGETDATGTFAFSVPKYAVKVIANGSDVEKTLAKDVLAYVKAAYNYFTDYNDAKEIARVNALIDSIIGDYTAAPTVSGVTAKDNAGIVTDVTLNLDSKPTIRFYVTDTTVSFYLNGKKLNTVSGVDEEYGAYVELDVYAYALAETITFGDGGSYHVSSFVNGSNGTAHEALVNAFVKYVESAAAYRNSVINK